MLCYLLSRPRVIRTVVNEPRVCALGLKRVDVWLCVCALLSAEMAAHFTLLLPRPTHRGFPLGLATLPTHPHCHGSLLLMGRATMVEEVANHKEKGETSNNGWRRDCRLGPRRKIELSNRDFPALMDTSGVQMRFFGTRTIRSIERDCFCSDSVRYEIQTNNRHGIFLEKLLFIRTSRKRLTDWTSLFTTRTTDGRSIAQLNGGNPGC